MGEEMKRGEVGKELEEGVGRIVELRRVRYSSL